MGWVQPSRMIILILRGRVRLGAEVGVKKVSLFFFSFQGPFRREGKRIIERWLPSYSYSKGWPIPQLLEGSSIYLSQGGGIVPWEEIPYDFGCSGLLAWRDRCYPEYYSVMFRSALQGLLDYRTRVFFLPCSTELLLSSCVSGLALRLCFRRC